jgi:DNA-binding FadR family transcriptional regulator
VCELWLVKRRSPNKAKKVSNQHGAATGHEMEAMVEDED